MHTSKQAIDTRTEFEIYLIDKGISPTNFFVEERLKSVEELTTGNGNSLPYKLQDICHQAKQLLALGKSPEEIFLFFGQNDMAFQLMRALAITIYGYAAEKTGNPNA